MFPIVDQRDASPRSGYLFFLPVSFSRSAVPYKLRAAANGLLHDLWWTVLSPWSRR